MWSKKLARGRDGGRVSREKEYDNSEKVGAAACGIDSLRRSRIGSADSIQHGTARPCDAYLLCRLPATDPSD